MNINDDNGLGLGKWESRWGNWMDFRHITDGDLAKLGEEWGMIA